MSALSTVATLPFVATPAIAQEGSLESDREILELAARILTLLPAYNAASEATCAADDAAMGRKPAIPDVLLWRATDPVQHSGELIERDGKQYLACDLWHIERRKEKPRLTWKFVGPGDEFEKSTQDDFDDDGYPLPRVAHLWQGNQSARDAKRLAELVGAAEEYEAASAAVRKNLRCDELLEEFERISEEMGSLVQRLVALRASSLPALRAKAAVYAQHLHVGYRNDSIAMDDQFEFLAGIIEDLGGGDGRSASGGVVTERPES